MVKNINIVENGNIVENENSVENGIFVENRIVKTRKMPNGIMDGVFKRSMNR